MRDIIYAILDTIKITAGVLVLWFFFSWLATPTQVAHDDTDPPRGFSGMSLYIDAKTGCQYLGVATEGLAPRLNGAGKQEGCK